MVVYVCYFILILQIVQQGLMSQADYDEASSKALSLFEYGQVTYLNSLSAQIIYINFKCLFKKRNAFSKDIVFVTRTMRTLESHGGLCDMAFTKGLPDEICKCDI